MAYSDWMNVFRCAQQRRIEEGLDGHWSHWDLPRYQELTSAEYHMQLAALQAGC